MRVCNIHTISGQNERAIPGKDAATRSRFKKTCVRNPITQVASSLAATQRANPYWVVLGDCNLSKDEAMEMAMTLPMKVVCHGDQKDFIFSNRNLVRVQVDEPPVAHDNAHTAVIAAVRPEVLHMTGI